MRELIRFHSDVETGTQFICNSISVNLNELFPNFIRLMWQLSSVKPLCRIRILNVRLTK